LIYSQKYIREYNITKYEPCATGYPLKIDWKIASPVFNDKITFSGLMTVFEKISGPLHMSLVVSRCTLDLKTCRNYNTFNMKEVCKKFSDTAQFYSNVFTTIKPPLKCPLLPGNYTQTETTLSFQIVEFLPIDGYIYTVIANLASTEKDRKTTKISYCMKMEVKITKSRVKS
jgi:hypothetical protein